jgi:hypothetical protein
LGASNNTIISFSLQEEGTKSLNLIAVTQFVGCSQTIRGLDMKTYHQQSSGLQFMRYICGSVIIKLVFILSTGVAAAVNSDPKVDNNQYDARIAFNQGFIQNLVQPQQINISRMAQKVPDLAFTGCRSICEI